MSNTPPLVVLQVQIAGCGQDEHPISKSEITIGRAADNEVILDDLKVSGHHLRLVVGSDGSVTAMDLGALNGTQLNGQPLLPRQPCAVQPGDQLQIESFTFGVRPATAQAPSPPAVAERVRVSAAPQPCLAAFSQEKATKHALRGGPLHLGRSSDNDIVIPLTPVSSRHARLEPSGDGWLIHDMGSTNGLFFQGQRVQQQALGYGDVIYIGHQEVALQLRSCMGFVPARSAQASVAGFRTIKLDTQDTITIGRAPDNDIAIDHPQVSRYHALIERLGSRRRVKDLKSANGVYINGRRIDGEAWPQEGDEIFVGPIRLRLAAGGVQQIAEQGVRIDAVRLRKQVTKTKNLLQDVSLSIQPQEFVALVGLSGAGKSTLLNALNGFKPATQGLVLANGVNLYRNFDLFRSDVGYVPQDNIVHTNLSVYKALDYAAQLRMPADISKSERHKRIMEVLNDLDLVTSKDLAINKLSGGQLKRVSIGVELLTKPRLFFLDEPTSGLDPGTEYNMMRLLRKLADQGRTILLVTHATKNVMMCDKVLILVRGGYVAFYGPPEEALRYFDQYRTDHERRIKDIEFDDTYTVLEDKARGGSKDWHARYLQSPVHTKYVTERFRDLQEDKHKPRSKIATRRPRVSTIRQFGILTRRYLDLVVRDKVLLTVLLVIMPAIALLLLSISSANWLVGDSESEIARQLVAEMAGGKKTAIYALAASAQRLLNLMVLAAILLGLFASAYELVKERSIFQRERMATLRLFPYLSSKVVILFAFALLQCFLFLIVVGFKVDFPKDGMLMPAPIELYITLVLSALAAIMMGLLVSALVPNSDTVIYVVLLILFFQLIFSGITFELPERGAALSKLTLTRWANEALGTSSDIEGLNNHSRTRIQMDPITHDVPIEVQRPGSDGQGPVTETVIQTVTIEPSAAEFASALDFGVTYDHTTQNLFSRWLALLVMSLLFGLGTMGILRWRESR